ncbi:MULTISPECIES: glycosyltransferase family 9 protein [unclassified Mesorhizobium]|uniref:glycosyltransferase family 9 protein n=1 Tax=unclassified Mesorhizobium TaxID=325217 RepID=UPI000FD98CB0|nr:MULTISPECIES: glycosyltransferase family 9 protein [unclassified Mesorhizobium]TGQ04844.1 glycosyltransferase family 9 protein [Mesorhizobium sp. M2E.F.Ca.ET.219.01.1.1]TGT65446.1 glycosyltransferase family 9 protein [Mesorhizobium sp. M2E.F.Ca.ET.166.01.1.1]TGV97492.1 glycosyltransferase family 9 protein [Mesorhizobium sp. M2E.F.Ca.ET.154.01.1.1]
MADGFSVVLGKERHARPIVASILVIQTKYIGDMVLTSAVVRNLRLSFPGARITILCTPGLCSFVVAQKIADDALGFDRRGKGKGLLARLSEYYDLIGELRRRRFDLTIDLSDSRTSRLLHGLVGAPLRVGFEPPENPLRFWERQPANIFAEPSGPEGPHYLHRYLSPLRALNINVTDATPRLEPTAGAREEAKELLAVNELIGNAYIAVHAGARFEGRCWQPQHFATVIDEIFAARGLRTLLIGGPDETESEKTILASTVSPAVSLVGRVSLETLVALLSNALIFLGNESGPMHLAASTGTPVVGLYGLTPPDVWSPVGVPHRTLAPPLPCQCVAAGMCMPNNPGRVYCVHRLRVDDVVAATLDLIDVAQNRGLRAEATRP